MSDAIHDMVAYTQLNDTVLQQIMMSENKKLAKVANTIFKTTHITDLYCYRQRIC